MSEQILLPCPFCGGNDLEITDKIIKGIHIMSYVLCDSCLATVGYGADTCRSSAVQTWNTRAGVLKEIEK